MRRALRAFCPRAAWGEKRRAETHTPTSKLRRLAYTRPRFLRDARQFSVTREVDGERIVVSANEGIVSAHLVVKTKSVFTASMQMWCTTRRMTSRRFMRRSRAFGPRSLGAALLLYLPLPLLATGCKQSKPADEVAQTPGTPTVTPIAGRSNGGAIAAETEDGEGVRPAKNYASTP